MFMRTATFACLAVAFVVLSLAIGCSPTLVMTTPKLPPGFAEARVPPGQVSAYVYVAQDKPTQIPLKRFRGEASRTGLDPAIAARLPEQVGVDRLAAWVGPSISSAAGTVAFREETSARVAEELLSGRPEVKGWRVGSALHFVGGTGDWSSGMERTLRAGEGSPFSEVFPAVWDLLRLLPEAPPAQPVAAGFIHVDAAILDSLAAEARLNLGGVAQALGTIRVTDVAFVAYADKFLTIPEKVTPEFLRESGAGALLVVRSEYPGVLLGFFLSNFSGALQLAKESLSGGQEAMYRDLQGAHLFIKPLGNVLFLAIAPEKKQADALMASALAQQGQK